MKIKGILDLIVFGIYSAMCITALLAIAMEARRGETGNTDSTAEGGDSAGRKASPK